MIIAFCIALFALAICLALLAWFLDAFNKLDRTNEQLMFENEQLKDKLRRGIWYS